MSNGQPHVQRILLIDDSPEDRARIRAALIQGGSDRRYEFREACNGEEGLKLCHESTDWPIDCVIVDIHMPKVNGIELLNQLRMRKSDHVTRYPVIVLTGSDGSNDASVALRSGAQDYVTKSAIYPSVLFRVVDNAIERHAMVKRLHASERKAASASRAKSAFIGNISHEIRTPMTAVLGLCELLLDTETTDDQRNMLTMIRDNGKYLVEIVNDLLDLSKMEAGVLQIERSPTELPGLLNELFNLMRVRANENQVRLRLDAASELPERILVDPIRLRQILLNLLGNAIKFSPGGEVVLEVKRKVHDDQEFLVYSVVDTGCGIAEDDLDLIFEPFAQSGGDQKQRSNGTGLGLSISRRLAKAMGGTVSAKSKVGQGSTFTLAVPLVVASSVDDSSAEHVISLAGNSPASLENCHVVLAEDVRSTQVLMKRIIEAAGGRITIIENGRELVDFVQKNAESVSVVVTDIQMPGVNGLQATQEILAVDDQIPVIVLTADASSRTRKIALEAGAREVVTKPIDRSTLLETISTLSENRRLSLEYE
ncbi:hybrid sensor histidine kinase/response regulator [Rubinisphaera margarita]|uniref:hybrid sensor histidine kinase/response regulator n=1 Tax=Rubinisphaera margarita TaxID=2909586 RepID=UPI001EE89D96|nr:hybrid sensor histidine kinase/response regulator [Rubinisphaera margarita]MCG6156456.1 response regulator [Rubinisphaera margarita]